MWTLFFGVTFGLLASSRSGTTVRLRSCSHAGVFLTEGGDRYALSFEGAKDHCLKLRSELASEEQVRVAYDKGLETCRYGWISNGNVTILRKHPHENCFANKTGIFFMSSSQLQDDSKGHFDALCYDNSSLADKDCSSVINPVAAAPDNESSPESSDSRNEFVAATEKSYFNTEKPHVDSVLTYTDFETFQTGNGSTEAPDPHTVVVMGTDKGENKTHLAGDGSSPFNNQSQAIRPTDVVKYTFSDDTTGSGMPPHLSTGDVTTSPESETTLSEHPDETEVFYQVPSAEAEKPKGRMSSDVTEPASEGDNSNSTPAWLIILLVVVAVAAVLLVCAAVVTRNRWCGKHQSLMITKTSSDGNGAATSATSSREQEREQEMVTLMNKEKIQENGNTEEFTVITLEESPEKAQQA
ncbi:CD44 antigen [Denticeps clupeoides]|uniref:CD44 antigen n=1 Tax=Denticeps clupeoides TaxID=299321 RepID=UPI0010A346E1|nr:CD44 antigen [Denticeps clupeoides]